MFAPLLPFLSDGRSSLKAMFQLATDLKVDSILVDALNARPRVWPSVAGLLRDHFPELRQRYSKILFDPKVRAEYLAQFRSDVAIAAERLSLMDRITECF
jgi:DNA repair photolyase